MSNSEKLDKLIQMVRDLDKRVVVIQNVLGVKIVRMKLVLVIEEVHKIMKMKKIQLMKKQILVIKKSAPDDGNEKDTIAEEANSGDGRSAVRPDPGSKPKLIRDLTIQHLNV
ncbi:hypothetical protein F2Q68_00042994 [Brassica cretica]|uniref:Uncharacterized protein n=1 Tax=Brassica cretica TaxID=69181 RepID=A0A8S9LSL2_BRACR|nr:hypothetical protein F2Q68_00042994 [Brassica cretica]